MSLARFQDTRSIYTNQLHFCIIATTNINGKMTFTSTSKTEILRNILISDKDVQDPYTEKKQSIAERY